MVTSSAVVGSSQRISFGSHDERDRDHHPLPHAARELVRVGAARGARGSGMPTSRISSSARARARLARLCPSCTSGPSAIWSPTRITGLSAVIGSWKIIDTSCRAARAGGPRRQRITSTPSITTWPAGDLRRGAAAAPRIARSAMLLPDPDSPTRPSASPGPTSNDAPSTARSDAAGERDLDLQVAHARAAARPLTPASAGRRARRRAATARAR